MPTCSDIRVCLAREDVTALVVATSAATHASIAYEALMSDKDVLVEKPMALSVAEAERLVETACRVGRTLMVGHVLEYHPAILRLRELLARGELGRIQYIYSNRLNLGRIRVEENALWSFAPHDIALVLRLLGELPLSVACQGSAYINRGVPDVTLTSLSFGGAVQAHIFVSWLHPFKEQRFVVVGDRQMAVFDDSRPWHEKLQLYPHRVDWHEGEVPVANRAGVVAVPLCETEPLRAECEHFLKCLEAGENPMTDGESGVRTVRVLSFAQRSLERHGETVLLEEDKFFGRPHQVHPTATVDSGARIGAGTKIWHYTHVMRGAIVGKNCVVGQNVFIGGDVRIGDGVKIQNNVSVYEGVELEDHVFCGPSMVFTNVIRPRSEIDRKSEFGKTLVKKGATLGANCTVLCGIEVGRYALVGAGAVVTKSVPDHALVYGSPALQHGWVCRCGSRLAGGRDLWTCSQCGDTYRERPEGGLEHGNP